MDTTSQITGGTIAFEDGVKAAEEYAPPKKAKVELSFAVAEGADMARAQTIIDHVAFLAQSKVCEMIGKKAPSVVTDPSHIVEALTTAPIVTGAQVAADLAKERKTRKSKVDLAVNFVDEKVDPAAIVDTQPDPAAIVDDAAVVDDEPLMLEDVIALPDASAVVDEDWNVTDEAAPEITDLDMGNATTKRNGELGDPKLIRDLIATFNPDPSKPAFQLRQIPQAQRQDYLDKLAALKKA